MIPPPLRVNRQYVFDAADRLGREVVGHLIVEVENVLGRFAHFRVLKRRPARQQTEEHAARRPQVRLGLVGAVAQHFGREKVWRSANLLLLGGVVVDGKAEVGEFGDAPFEEDVAEFDVAMDDAMAVEIGECLDHLMNDFDRGIFGNPFHGGKLQQMGQGTIGAVFEHKANLLSIGPVRQELDNVSVITTRLDCHFRENLLFLFWPLNPLSRHYFDCRSARFILQ